VANIAMMQLGLGIATIGDRRCDDASSHIVAATMSLRIATIATMQYIFLKAVHHEIDTDVPSNRCFDRTYVQNRKPLLLRVTVKKLNLQSSHDPHVKCCKCNNLEFQMKFIPTNKNHEAGFDV
jgi:hypothetical protein